MRKLRKQAGLVCKMGCVMVLCAMVLSGCGGATNDAQRTSSATKSVNDVMREKLAEDASSVGELAKDKLSPSKVQEELSSMQTKDEQTSQETVPVEGDVPAYDTIDVDLTQMSSTMVYSEVLNIMQEPSKYLGKVVRMNGTVQVYTDPNTGITYRTCIIQDATACCAQGIEFELGDGSTVETGDEVIITGVFDTYMEGKYMYCTLRNAVKTGI